MFRKFFAAVVALMLVVGGLFADDIKGVFKKFEDNKVTIEVDGKEKTYKVDPDAKIKRKGKDGQETEVALSKILGGKFMQAGKTNLTLTVKDDTVTNAKIERRKKTDN